MRPLAALATLLAVGCASVPYGEEEMPTRDAPAAKAPATTVPETPETAPDPTTPTVPPGTPAPVVLADKLRSPRGVAVDDANVYFASQDDGTILKVPTAGGAVARIDMSGSVTQPWVHAVDATHVYFAAGAVGRVLKTGGPIEILVPNVRPWSIAIDGSSVYFSDQPLSGMGSIKKVSKTCTAPCTPTTIAANQEFPMGVATDGTSVYWANQASDVTYAYPGGPETGRTWKGTLRRWSANATSTLLENLQNPAGVALGGDRVFVGSTQDAYVRSVTTGNGDPRGLRTKTGTPYWMTADTTHVYWLDGGAGTSTATLYRASNATSVPEVLATKQNGPIGIAVDSKAVYWANHNGGQIMRMAKP